MFSLCGESFTYIIGLVLFFLVYIVLSLLGMIVLPVICSFVKNDGKFPGYRCGLFRFLLFQVWAIFTVARLMFSSFFL